MALIIRNNKEAGGSLSPALTLLLKGICCLLVGFHHYARVKVEQFGSANPVWLLLAHHGGNIGVGLFFFLSGYGLQESAFKKRLTVKEVVLKRFWKIYWPLLAINAVFVVIATSLKDIDLFGLFINFKSIDPVLWFIEILFGCYAIFYAAQFVENKRSRNAVLYGLGTVLLMLVMVARPEQWWHFTNIPMFFIGVLYSQCKSSRFGIGHLRLWHFAAGIAVLGLMTVALWVKFHSWWSFLCISLMALLIVLMFAKYWDVNPSYQSKMGKISYEYYLTHNKVILILLNINILPPPHFVRSYINSVSRTDLYYSAW